MDIKVLIKNIKCYCRPYQLGRPIVNAGVRYAADQAGRAVRRRVGDVVEYGNQLVYKVMIQIQYIWKMMVMIFQEITLQYHKN
eukprot:scaffold136367_cov16-Tisochrysis_lutea.AAC.1